MFRVARPSMQPWRRLRCESVATYPIFEVCRVELEDAAGRARGEAFTLRGSDWCNVIAVTPDDHLVLVWQYRFGTGSLSLEIPGGVIDPGESPEQAARRELREETGYEADELEMLLLTEPNPAVQNNRCFTFVARGARPAAETQFDELEELETTLVPASALGDLLDGGQVTHSLVQGALETYWRKRRSGRSIERLVMDLEEQQRRKVFDLARRLRPGITPEDARNPHDFPELVDPDWQYQDGMLAGIQAVLAALRASEREQ